MLASQRHIGRLVGRLMRNDASVVCWGKERSELPHRVKSNPGRRTIVGTLSFPVGHGNGLRDNSDLIAEIIRRRSPGLLLCAGWSISSERNLRPIMDATGKAETIVVLETSASKGAISFRIKDGRRFRMGKQFYATRDDTNKHPVWLTALAAALPERRFHFSGRPVLLLVCGEVMVVQGRHSPHFHRSAPPKLRDAVRAEHVLILNPTHTRMGNSGTIQAWRRFLSEKGRVYVSASNWRVSKDKKGRRQKPSPTLHSLWYDGKPCKLSFQTQGDCYCYREWVLPR